MPTVEEIRATCPLVEFVTRPDGSGSTCAFYSRPGGCTHLDGVGHCVVFPPDGAHLPGRPSFARDIDSKMVEMIDAMSWSWSRVNAWMKCPHKWKLHYIDNAAPEFAQKWGVVGSAYHAALESLYASEGRQMVFEGIGDPEADAEIAGVLTGIGPGQLYQPGAWLIEKTVNFEVVRPDGRVLKWNARMDLVDPAAMVVVDHKSTGADPAKFSLLDVVYQMSVYLIASQQLIEQSDNNSVDKWRVVINAIRKPKTKLNKGESIEQYQERIARDARGRLGFYFRRLQFHGTEFDPFVYFGELVSVIESIRSCAGRGLFPRNRSACAMMPCEYEGACIKGL